jgi:hypothetical protein
VLAYFLAEYCGTDDVSKFHLLGPVAVMIMSGTVAFESLVLGEAASGKIGYRADRAYQVQSGLNNLATALTALLVFALDWGRYADATVVTAMLLFFLFSGANHALSAGRDRNLKTANLMRPLMSLLLAGFLLYPMMKALAR